MLRGAVWGKKSRLVARLERFGALALLALCACKQGDARGPAVGAHNAQSQPPHFREGDYEAALAEALRKDVPLFVDVWASWCHSCMSMREYVLRDPALGSLADDFVWLSLDSEKAQNASFLERFPSKSIPTLWVIEPRAERPLLKWIGAATVSELLALLQQTQRDRKREPALAGTGTGELTALWLQGNRQSAAGHAQEAIELYRSALQRSGPDWPTRPLVLEALSMRLAETGQAAQSLQLATREATAMPKGTARVNVLVNALSAGANLRKDAPERTELPALIAAGTALVNDPELHVLADDRSGLYLALIETLGDDDPAAKKHLADRWAHMLEEQAAAAPSSAARRVWDPHRLEAYLALGEPQRAVPMLEQSEREAPTDYNPPARLARARLALGQLELAHAAIDRALARCDDPRKLRLYLLKADVLLAAHDRPAARSTLNEALAFARASPLPARYEAVRALVERRLLELS